MIMDSQSHAGAGGGDFDGGFPPVLQQATSWG
jgi:hypothetical protein